MDPLQYGQMAQRMLPTPAQPGGQQMPFQKPSTQMCKEAVDVLERLANQFKQEGDTAAYGQLTAMTSRLIKMCDRKAKEDNQIAEAVLGAQQGSMGQY